MRSSCCAGSKTAARNECGAPSETRNLTRRGFDMPHTTTAPAAPLTTPASSILERYRAMRATTEMLVEPLEIEDMVVQATPDTSPPRWHLAHTTWFFETFVHKNVPVYRSFHLPFEYLFYSYYNAVDPQWHRPNLGVFLLPHVPRGS